MSKTLLVRYSQIGDVLILIPVIYSLAKRYPDEDFTVLTNAKFEGIFRQMPSNVHLFPMIYRKKKVPLRGLLYLFDRYLLLLKIFFLYQYDKVAILQNGTFEKQLQSIFSLKKSKVASINLSAFLSPEKLIHKDYFNTPSLNDLYRRTIEELGYEQLQNEFNRSYYQDRARQRGLLEDNGIPTDCTLIGIAPFSRIPLKRYPLEKMEEVVAHFHSRTDVKLLIFGGGENERAMAETWKEKYPGIISLIGKLSFDDELVVIASCRCMVSMDSANLHMAALTGIPAVSIWGPSHPGLGYYPYNEPRECAVQQELPCRPCSFWGEKPCTNPQFHQCMDIDPEIIIKKILSLPD